MSYGILYRSMFIKTRDNKYIPMVEMGSNNVYDNAWKRARNWQQWYIDSKKLAYTKEEFMQAIENEIDKVKRNYVNKPRTYNGTGYWTFKDIEKHYGYFSCFAVYGKHCNDTSAQQIRNFFKRGFEQAVSIDEDRATIIVSYYKGQDHIRQSVNTEEELFALWEQLRDKYTLYISYDYYADVLWGKHKVKRATRITA